MSEFQWIQTGIAVMQIIGVPILLWIARILKKMYGEMKRDNRLAAVKVDSLVTVLDQRLNDGFKKEYNFEVERRISDYNFIYKEG